MSDRFDILIAEDNPSDAELIRESLGPALRERTQLVHDGVEALDFIFFRGEFANRSRANPLRFVVLDVKLPRVDGLEVLRQLKQDQRTASIPVIMLTSSRIEHDVARAYQFGANSYLQKPVEFERFREMVHVLGVYWLTMNERPPGSAFQGRDLA